MPKLADQVTAVVVVPVTVTVNCCVPPEATVAEVGEMVTATDVDGGVMVTVALADFVVSAWLVALTVTVVVVVTVGAVKRPALEIVPALVDHVTAVFVEPVTVALNCWVPPDATVVEVGEMEMETDMVLPPVLAKPVMARRSAAVVS